MVVTIERILVDCREARLVVGDAAWSSEELLRCGGRLAEEISSRFDGLRLLTVSSANAALLVVAAVAAGRLGVPVLLLDPEATSTSTGYADDVLISDHRVPDCDQGVTISPSLACWLAGRTSGSVCALPGDSILFQTSGSTATPRAVVKSVAAVVRDSARVADHLYGDISSAEVVCAAPVFHSYGFTHGLLAGLLVEARTVFRSPSSPPLSLARAAARSGASTLIALPTQVQMIAGSRPSEFAGLKQVVSAGAPLRTETVLRVCGDFGFRLRNAYGASEVGTCAIGTLTATSAPGSVGEPLDGVDVRVEPGDGELMVRNDSFAVGYLADGLLRPLPTEDGWYRTGDLAQRDADGVRITGRRDDLINIAGRKTRRSRLEAVLAAHPDVLEVQVVVAEDEVRGAVPVARVVVKPGHPRPDIVGWSRSRLDPFEAPRQVEWVDRLPRSATGKLIYAASPTEAQR
ncbi:hypothetical protein C6361_34470 [Plantactinospora sp. BC1]|nr:hypothetical protein C6361_34470 [Plantactinospora sp. BC1]